MPRPPDEVRQRFQNKDLLTPLKEACEKITHSNREETKSTVLGILENLPDFYNDIARTMKERAAKLGQHPQRTLPVGMAKDQFLGTLNSFLKDFENDFSQIPEPLVQNSQQMDDQNLNTIITRLGLQVTETESLPARPASYEQPPQALHANVKQLLNAEYPDGVYRHQAAGIQAYLDGADICLATSTASGKSLVFATAAADLLMRHPEALVIAMYPARALVQDQLEKWRQLGRKLGLRVGQIDGSVAMNQRHQILQDNGIVVMTPDVVHAWLMRELSETNARLQDLKLVILDEAHVYTGVFGTNMAYLLRRLQASSSPHRLIAATATIGDPGNFLNKLTGRESFHLIEDDVNGAPSGGKTIQLVNLRANARDRNVFLKTLLRAVALHYPGKFIAFADSRIGVESFAEELCNHGVMPYRSGYEDGCRKEIQNALNDGQLRGVVSTSALEIGVDIHDIDLVVILNYPPSINAFRQRLGRAGRSNRLGECLIVDTHGLVSGSDGGLASYLGKDPEQAHLYLGNKALEFGNALCAFDELSQLGLAEHVSDPEWSRKHFPNLPETFYSFLSNEMNPILALPSELEAIKQEISLGGAAPQLQIPLRGVYGTDFKLRVQIGHQATDLEPRALGYLTAAQRFREAYPGAIHRHMGLRYRVNRTLRGPSGWEIALKALPDYHSETSIQPTKLILPIYGDRRVLKKSTEGFVTTAMVQVHERIDGFSENGSFKAYDAGSPYSKKPFGHVRRSSGVLWFLGEDCADERILPLLSDALTSVAGISGREIGFGKVTQKTCPLFENCGTAFVIYDDTPGNFFLTDDLLRYWPEIVDRAKVIAASSEQPQLETLIEIFDKLRSRFLGLDDQSPNQIGGAIAAAIKSDENEWFLVIADGETVFRRSDVDFVEHLVTRAFMTRTGLKYELEGIQGGFDEECIVPASVDTKMEWFNMDDRSRRPYEQGPDYFVLQDLLTFNPPKTFELQHGNRYKMEQAPNLIPGKKQLVRDPRIAGGIAFGMVEQADGGWYRITSDGGTVASLQVGTQGSNPEFSAVTVE